MIKRTLLFATLLFLVQSSFGQLTLDAEYRPRAELRNGYKNSQAIERESAEFVISQRSLLGLSFSRNKVTGRLSFQDVRTWGETPSKVDVATIHLKEAWLEVSIFEKLQARIGRQVLKYDNQRILAATNWNQVGTQHDLLLLKYSGSKTKVHTGLAYNNETASDDFESLYPLPYYKAMFYAWFHHQFNERLNLSLLAVNDLNAKPNTSSSYYSRYTYGATIKFSPIENFSINTTGYLQSGETPAGADVNAHMLMLQADLLLTEKSSAFTGFDLFSGDDPNQQQTTSHIFDRLYGAKHKYMGYMDYFPVSSAGIFNAYAGAKVNLSEKIQLGTTFHTFTLPHEYTHPANAGQYLNKFLGAEMDIVLSYNPYPELNFQWINGFVKGTETMDFIKGGTHEQLSYVSVIMLTWKPAFDL
ncbi:MAG: alginate export family protein [Bacteroidales bacterium]